MAAPAAIYRYLAVLPPLAIGKQLSTFCNSSLGMLMWLQISGGSLEQLDANLHSGLIMAIL